MKSKKSLLLMAFSVIFALGVCLFSNNSLAKADSFSVVDCVFGVTYDAEYLLEKAGVAKLEGETTFLGGRTLKYKLSTQEDDKLSNVDKSVKITSNQEYTFVVFAGETEENRFTANVVDKSQVKADSMAYNTADSQLIDDYKAEISKVITDGKLDTNDSFTVPSVEKLLSSKYFKYADLTKTIYYATPQSTSYSSTSSSKFSLTSAGYYSYYVLATDPINNKMDTDGLTEKVDGWYNESDELVIPIFSFEIKDIAAPQISVLTSENGYIGLDYSIECFTINATNYTTNYSLYYSETLFDKDDQEYKTDADYIKAVLEDGNTVDITDEYLNLDSLKFTPDKKGYYYVLLNVGDNNGLTDRAMSRAISVQTNYTVYSVESEWLKYNTTSIVFLSIAVVSFIALIAVLFIKPKDYNVSIDMNE